MQHSDWYRLIDAYWWLLFPLAWGTIFLLALVMPRVDVSALANLPREYDIALAAVLTAVTMLLPRLSRN